MSIIRFHTASDDPPNQYTVTAAMSLQNSTEINIRDFAGGGILIGDQGSTNFLTFYVAARPGGTYRVLCDRDGMAVQQTVAGSECAYALPDEIYGFGALKIVVNDGLLNLVVSLKG